MRGRGEEPGSGPRSASEARGRSPGVGARSACKGTYQVCTGALVGLLGWPELPRCQLQGHAVAVATVAARCALPVLLNSSSGPAMPLPSPPTTSSPHSPDLWVLGQQEVAEFLEQEEDIKAAECHHEAPGGLWAVAVCPVLAVPTVLVQPQNLGGQGELRLVPP